MHVITSLCLRCGVCRSTGRTRALGTCGGKPHCILPPNQEDSGMLVCDPGAPSATPYPSIPDGLPAAPWGTSHTLGIKRREIRRYFWEQPLSCITWRPAPKTWVSPATFQAPLSHCLTKPISKSPSQPGHPNQISPEGAQLEDNSQRVKHKSEEIKMRLAKLFRQEHHSELAARYLSSRPTSGRTKHPGCSNK